MRLFPVSREGPGQENRVVQAGNDIASVEDRLIHPFFWAPFIRDPKKDISISISDVPTLLGFMIRGVIWDIPIPIFCVCAFLGPYFRGLCVQYP